MNIIEIIQNNMVVFIAMGVACLLSIIYSIIRLKGMKRKNTSFLQQHPDAAKIYLTSKALITSEAVMVAAVEGEPPYHFTENGKTGIYVKPGRSKLDLSYTYTRPGVIHKQVTESTGMVQKVFETEPYQSYLLGFDRKDGNFTFTKFTG